jgi:hypothetical protein
VGLKLGLTLSEKYGLKMFVNWVLTRISGPIRGELNGYWRKLHNVELYNVYSSPNIINILRYLVHVLLTREFS